MKTSFYFVIWAVILFIFLQFIMPWNITRYEFEITCFIVFCIYWILNHLPSSQNRFLYEKKLRRAKIIERKETGGETNSKISIFHLFNALIITFFIISTIFIAWTLCHIQVSDWWGLVDWIGLVIFVFFSYKIIIRHIDKLYEHRYVNSMFSEVHIKPIDNVHNREFIDHVKSSEPRNFKLYQQANIVFAVVSILLGCAIGFAAIYLFLTHNENRAVGVASILYLYGSLAAYYGVKDLISSVQSLRIEQTILHK